MQALVEFSTHIFRSSAKDQLTASPVAIKKIMKPFSTPVLSKRTYRELKLLKHLRHENVCFRAPFWPSEPLC
jgi:serine/threonine protein kinase